MGILDDNISAIKEYKKYLLDMLKTNENKQISDCDLDFRIFNEYAINESKYMYIMSGDSCIRINSMYNPQNEAEYWTKNIVDCYNNMLITCVMFGLGNGYFVRELLNAMDENDVIVLYEPSRKIFDNVLSNYDISDIISDERILIIVGEENFDEYRKCVYGIVGAENVTSAKIAIHPYYDMLFRDIKDEFMNVINKHIMDCIVLRNTYNASGKIMVTNELYGILNLKDSMVMYDLKEQMRAMSDETAIIVSAGPSLVKNINSLKLVGDGACIIAVDRIADVLLNEGIIPDAIVSVDSRFPLDKFQRDEWKDITLMCDFISNTEVIKAHPKKKIYIGNTKFIKGIMEKINKQVPEIEMGGSVATVTAAICVELGFKNIILCGQDLAYGEGDITHADGLHEENLTGTGQDIYVEGVDGNMVRSRWDWTGYRYFFEKLIHNFPNINFIDGTEGGAKIKGTKIMTLEDAIMTYCNGESGAKKILCNPVSSIGENEAAAIESVMKEHKDSIVEIECICKEIINVIDDIIKLIDDNDSDEVENKIKIFEEKIDDFNKNGISKLLVTYVGDDINGFRWNLFVGKKDNSKSLKYMYERYKLMFEELEKKLPDVAEMFESN